MAASANDMLQKVGVAGTLTSLSAPGHSISGTTITVGSTTNWPTDTGVTFAIRQVDSSGVLVAGTYTEWRGVVSGSTLTSMVLAYGTDQVYPAGSTTQVYIPVSAYSHNRMIDALTAEHSQLDGTHTDITADSVASAGPVSGTTGTFTSDITEKGSTLTTQRDELVFDHVASGCVWSGDSYGSTLAASMTSGVIYLAGKRLTVATVTARAFTASKDTYVDLSDSGSGTATITYTEVANNAASPALAAGSIRVAIIVTGASNIANVGSVNQGESFKVLPIASSVAYSVTDSLGNMICNRAPSPTVIGYRTQSSIGSNGQTSFSGAASCPVIVPSGRRVKVTVLAKWGGYNTSQANYGEVSAYEDGVAVPFSNGQGQIANTTTAGSNSMAPIGFGLSSPSAGLHTYTVTASMAGYQMAVASHAITMVELV